MPRNGLFADDGRIIDLVTAIKNKFANIVAKHEALDARDGALEASIGVNAGAIAAVATNADSAHDRLDALASTVAGKAKATDLTSLQGVVNNMYSKAQVDDLIQLMVTHINEVQDLAQAAMTRALPAFGKLAKTDGFQIMNVARTAINMAVDTMGGGLEHSVTNGGGIRVTDPGYYFVAVNGYFTGGINWYGSIRASVWYNGVLSHDIGSVILNKTLHQDQAATRAEIVYLNAGAVLTVSGSSSDGVGSTWGDSGRVGTTLSVFRI